MQRKLRVHLQKCNSMNKHKRQKKILYYNGGGGNSATSLKENKK